MKKRTLNKSYTFRLTNNDEDLFVFLERLPSRHRSEMIRKMLNFSLANINELNQFGKVDGQSEEMSDEFLEEIYISVVNSKTLVEQNNALLESIHEEILLLKKNGVSNVTIEEELEEEEVDQSDLNTVNQLLGSFNVNFD